MRGFKIFVILFFAFVATSCGQQKKYISYSVKKGETMKVIAKRLDMKTRDLLRLNPDVGRRPKPNTVIIIPNRDFKEGVVTEEIIKEQIDSTDIAKTVIDIDELKKSLEEIVVLNEKNVLLEEQLKALQQKLNEVESSVSWKITKPLRLFKSQNKS